MRRRDFIAGIGGAAASTSFPAIAQSAAVIGYLDIVGPNKMGLAQMEAFRKGLGEAGFVEGRNVTIIYRAIDGLYGRYPAMATEMVRLGVAVIFANGPVGVRAAMAVTTRVPIVFFMGEDPVAERVVASLNQPGGNVTGFTDFGNQLDTKRLGLLCDAVPRAAVLAVLANPTHPNASSEIMDAQTVAKARGRNLIVAMARTEAELEAAFAALSQQQAGALIVLTDPFFDSRHEQIVALAARYAIPAMYDRREIPAAGGLMSYGVDRVGAYQQAGTYVGRILKGEKPADLPVQRGTKFEFVINLKTAKALGLDFPPGILAIADEVIE